MIRPLWLGVMVLLLAGAPAAAQPPPARADLGGSTAPLAVRHMADWVLASADNGTLPFVIIDKKEATVSVFTAQGQMLGSAPALLGIAIGDGSAPGIGNKPLSAIPVQDRTTPAGRFAAFMGHEPGKGSLLWVDYKNNIALHRVVKGTAKDRRAQRLASPTPLDNRITFGCINVPVDFFDRTVLATFKSGKGIVYILPEVRPMRDVFPTYRDTGA